MKNNILLLLSLCIVICSCEKEKEPSIIINKTDITVLDGSGLQTISFKSNMSWSVKSSESWCAVFPMNGEKSDSSITAIIAANDTYDSRSSTLTITVGTLSKTITITQNAQLGLIVTQSKFNISSDATTVEVEVKANAEFDIIVSNEWIVRNTTKALSSTKLSFNIANNESYDNREGTITITQKNGVLTSTIHIYQSQKDGIILSKRAAELSYLSQILEVELKTNVEFEVIIPDAAKSWVFYAGTKALSTRILTLLIASNQENNFRVTEVYLKNNTKNLQDTLIIKQNNEPYVYRVKSMGTLGAILNQIQKDTITKMIVKGEINKTDFEVMKMNMPNLRYLDLKDVKCEGDKIPNEAFGSGIGISNRGINTIILPLGITSIEDFAFYGCTGLSGILNLPNRLIKIEGGAFHGCVGLSGVLDFPDGLTTIGIGAFHSCTGFNGSLNLPSRLNIIGSYAFFGCAGFTGSLNLPDALTTMGVGVFKGCSGFNGVLKLSNSLTQIDKYAFAGCTGFTGSLNLPTGLTTIEQSAFYECKKISGTVIFPIGISIIMENAFSRCDNLNSFRFPHTTPLAYYVNMFPGGSNIEVPNSAVPIYKTTNGWKDYNIVGY